MVDRGVCAHRSRQRHFGRPAGDCDHVRSHRLGDLHRRETATPGRAGDEHNLIRTQMRSAVQRVQRSAIGEVERGCVLPAHLLGNHVYLSREVSSRSPLRRTHRCRPA